MLKWSKLFLIVLIGAGGFAIWSSKRSLHQDPPGVISGSMEEINLSTTASPQLGEDTASKSVNPKIHSSTSFKKTHSPKRALNNAHSSQSADQLKESLIKKLMHRDPKGSRWNVEQNENGLVKTVYGGVLPELGKSPEDLKAFIESISEELGVSSEQFVEKPKLFPSPISIIYDFYQYYQGYPVEDGFLRVQSTPEGGVYYLVSELKKIEKPLLNKSSDLNLVKKILKEKYSNREFTLEENPMPLKIYVAPDGTSELSWIIFVKFSNPPLDRRKIVIGSETLKFYLDESQLRNFHGVSR